MSNTVYNKSNLELANKIVGSRLLAYILGLTSTEYINSKNDNLIKIFVNDVRFIVLMEIIEIIGVGDHNCFSPITFQSWMQGINPYLGEEAPGRVLRNIKSMDDPNVAELMVAARHFSYS